MKRLSTPLRNYVIAVSALGLILLGVAFFAAPLQATPLTLSLTVALAALIGLAGVYPIPLSQKIKANVATAPAFVAVLLLSPALAIAAAVTGVIASELVQKRKLPFVVFNSAVAALYVGTASLAYSALHSEQGFFSWPTGVPAAVAAVALMYTVNRAAVAEAVAIQLHKSAFRIWLSEFKQDAFQELALVSLGFAGAIAVNQFTWAIIPLALPVFFVYKTMSKVVALSTKLEAQMTELRNTQAQLVQAAKMASLGTLTAGLGHQINNPIFVIRGRTELLLEGADRHIKTDKARQHIEVIHEMSDRVARIVRCLLTSTRPTEDGAASTNVNDALETMVSLLDSKLSSSRVHVVRNYSNSLPMVPGDSIEIQELFGNLISNACDAMPEGGYLRLTTRTEGQTVVTEVSDTGTGISEADVAKIFDPFFTTKEMSGGMGLGLYVVKNIAQKHGGKVEVESGKGKGTTFRIVLPATDVQDQSCNKPAGRYSRREKVAV